MKSKYFFSVIISALILLSISSCSKSSSSSGNQPPPPPGGNSNLLTINISGMAFPDTTVVAKGSSVAWYNGDSFAHTVTSNDGTSFNSGNLAAGATFSYVAKTAGTFPYHCNIHANMKGVLVVNP